MNTEAEAKTKWCPFIRHAVSEGRGIAFNNRWTGEPVTDLNLETKCIGSACMAWRWADYERCYAGEVIPQKHRTGYCGAFGIPLGAPQ